MRFQDRREAGRRLAGLLVERQRQGRLDDPVVLALPRGGVPVGDELAGALHAPLDVVVVRKIGAPYNPEVGIGALVGDQPPIFDDRALAVLGLTPERLSVRVDAEREEVRRRERLYRGGRPAPELRGRTAVVVDDGLATGVTARAALRAVRAAGPARLLLAVPVCSRQAVTALSGEADEIVYVYQPPYFEAVGQWYDDFDQLTDDEVIRTLSAAHGG
ncbi:phosphoribosyltransferase [Streptomyces sp. WAC05374]|uniref:phosphoribosyltransferase n=1 Tax=Streptomyces sp. WAC05374 TaxID=2487420 RepID=UPI000F88E4C5|nr:phosphoribosyltransferase family protein [Streptomyces sp. WAC05374]RST02572.1 phosphoribosyltransferase [Streptomyces sp. WAC05374]TDF42620.1 phosphoribosyltransferase [Streptomyces sp. WAC05374]TDF51180.1 phosphoribosyltransferase [Streptomyces sp. WAC05374]TDF52493.1 phosphoribosyltransferase [Streptomyces sp. WAC05374]